MDLVGAGRTIEPGMEARPRHVQHVAKPADGPDVAVLGDEGEPHVHSADCSDQWRNQPQTRAKKQPPSSRHVTLRPDPSDLFLQGCNLGEVGPHLPIPGKRIPLELAVRVSLPYPVSSMASIALKRPERNRCRSREFSGSAGPGRSFPAGRAPVRSADRRQQVRSRAGRRARSGRRSRSQGRRPSTRTPAGPDPRHDERRYRRRFQA